MYFHGNGQYRFGKLVSPTYHKATYKYMNFPTEQSKQKRIITVYGILTPHDHKNFIQLYPSIENADSSHS